MQHVTDKDQQRIRLGIVGCGAVTQSLHLPALARVPELACVAFVDKNLDKARQLAREGQAAATTEYQEIFDSVDAVLIAVPNVLHRLITTDFLNHNIHVLLEKPMAPTVSECEAMLETSHQTSATLSVAYMRRFFPNRQKLKSIVESGRLGKLQRLEMSDGIVSTWPQTLDFFRREKAGGGVMMDMGVHELDIMLWLLGEPVNVTYADDALGGIESNAQVDLLFPADVEVSARFSRTADLANRMRLEGDQGWVELTVWDWNRLRYFIKDDPACQRGPVEILPEGREIDLTEVYARQLRGFTNKILTGNSQCASAKDGVRVVRVVEQCYQLAGQNSSAANGRSKKDKSWVWRPKKVGKFSRLKGKTALITGATGFVGGRLAERLVLDEGLHVRALVRRPSEARWISRLPVEMVPGDITDLSSLENAAAGCQLVYHCAATMTGSDTYKFHAGNVVGTEQVIQAALKAGVERFIHLSTIAVHGNTTNSVVNEQSPYQTTGQPYGDSKIEAEKIVLRYIQDQDLPAVIIRPTLVYGPRCRWFTIEPIKKIRANYMALVENGQGLFNAIYIDNLIDALLLATENEAAVGEIFIVSDEPPITWGKFLNCYAAMLDKAPLPNWPASMLNLAFSLHHVRVIRRFVRRWPWLSPEEVEQMKNQTRFDAGKAHRLLGYKPRISLEEGMEQTQAWLEDQGYLR